MSFPGIPPLLNRIAGLERTVVLLVRDGQRIVSLFSQAAPQWGLYRNGKPVLTADSVLSISPNRSEATSSIARFDYRADYKISDYPVEKGGFQSYNKVKTPSEIRLRMMKGGSQSARAAFLGSLATLQASLDLVDVYMPEAKYKSMNVKDVDFSRGAEGGVGLLSVDVVLVEIMQTVVPSFSNTAADSGQSPQNGGTVLPSDATDPQAQRAVGRGGGSGI